MNRPEKIIVQAGDEFLASRWGGCLPCSNCDALTPLAEVYTGCYCLTCATEIAVRDGAK